MRALARSRSRARIPARNIQETADSDGMIKGLINMAGHLTGPAAVTGTARTDRILKFYVTVEDLYGREIQ